MNSRERLLTVLKGEVPDCVPVAPDLSYMVNIKRGGRDKFKQGVPAHVHSCGPEKELVRIFAEETDLTVIDPLEKPPMGDCDSSKKKAIDNAGSGGRFILSTGGQCGRDTPDENIRAMVETARTYGKY